MPGSSDGSEPLASQASRSRWSSWSRRRRPPPTWKPDAARPSRARPAMVTAGRQLANLHRCTSCHRPGLVGQQQVPRLAGQDFDYLLRLLRSFKAKTASDLDGMMTMSAQPLQEEDLLNLVHFMASLGGE